MTTKPMSLTAIARQWKAANRPAQICSRFDCTLAQLSTQYQRNAMTLDKMAERAERTGKLVNGYSAEYLRRAAQSARVKAEEIR